MTQGGGKSRAPTPSGAVLAILCVGAVPERWASSITSLVAADVPVLLLVTGDPETARRMYEGLPVRVEQWTLPEACTHLVEGDWSAGFVATSPIVVPQAPFERALEALQADIRVCTVSFLSNNANYLSFPHRNVPSSLVANGHDERSLTRALRKIDYGQAIVPIPVPAGGAILLSSPALRALGGVDGQCPSAEIAILDVALRGIKRGFRNVLDPSTFIVKPSHAGDGADALNDQSAREWLQYRHHFFPTLYDIERDAQSTPLADSIALRRAAVFGLRILFDGSCLGPFETGTQVSVLAQIEALVRHPGVAEVIVGTPGGLFPPYAREVLMQPEVRVCAESGGLFPDVDSVDILHRAFQPSGPLPFERWRSIARRTVVTIQDLIAFDNGNYHANAESWLSYRNGMTEGAQASDAVVSISNDTAEAIRQARFAVAPGALHVIECGTDHITAGKVTPVPPIELLENGATAAGFILVLGASYSHKNRDLAIRAWQELRRRGHPIKLVMAGVVVPIGSTRNEEALVASRGEWPLTLADVTTAERDWLLSHAAVVLYPTSAEGFGLVPFEAAAMGTPTVFVNFGPLAELLPCVPVSAEEWSPLALADAMVEVFSSPDLARQQVDAILKVAEDFTWDRCADRLVDVYLRTLGAAVVR